MLEVLYLLFNEGYSAHSGDVLVRQDICVEALRITTILAGHELGAEPRVQALTALMCFHISRLATRTDGAGDILLLKDQDRTLWDQNLIARGADYLMRAAQGETLSSYHLQAGVAACHALAPSYEDTDWQAIVGYYDQMLVANPSPVVALNRAAAVAMAEGPARGLEELLPLKKNSRLAGYFLLHGIEGELRTMLGQTREAKACYQKALACQLNGAERRFVESRLKT